MPELLSFTTLEAASSSNEIEVTWPPHFVKPRFVVPKLVAYTERLKFPSNLE